MPALRDLDFDDGNDTAITAGATTSSTRRPTLYFAYGSNLWLAQMRRRCPSSVYLGVARLRSNGSSSSGSRWRWIINERGYANVVEIPASSSANSLVAADAEQEKEHDEDEEDVVYGTVYALPPGTPDEASLDAAEGVPVAYGKEYHAVDFWPCPQAPPLSPAKGGGGEAGSDVEEVSPSDLFVDVANVAPQRVEGVLVYVDRLRTAEGEPKEEYVGRMNEAVRDAVALGVPRAWVERCVRRFIPADQ